MLKTANLIQMILLSGLLAGCVATTGSSTAPLKSRGGIEQETGISNDAIFELMRTSDRNGTIYTIFYWQDQIDAAQLKAAPAKLCTAKNSKLALAKDLPLRHPNAIPGLRKLMVRCK